MPYPLEMQELLGEILLGRKSYGFPLTADVIQGTIRYNSKVEVDKATYEISLPGYSKEEVDVRLNPDCLEVSSVAKGNYGSYQIVGCAKSPFRVRFYLDQASKVERASMANGLLTIQLVRDSAPRGVSVQVD